MASVDLVQGGKYRGTVMLEGVDQLASNERVGEEFTKAGFTGVNVTGSGASREGTGVWSKPSQTAELPKQITSVILLSAPAAPPSGDGDAPPKDEPSPTPSPSPKKDPVPELDKAVTKSLSTNEKVLAGFGISGLLVSAGLIWYLRKRSPR